ncbi:hypothetical protein [Legionella hackeliae]|uniref:Uncharacterized protein n=1 Tax=Legionella hackeliae TaxID=449 RepID=A0A0A8USP4_LEGHA|nr:hypothetical protein [Legionella hackeliae]KTD09946.1 hypothetical protein Lhac_2314 [Legionella hackeliae]CEK11753.1 conserved exported protein of unknown function [Legionella hackeliae]STX48523.1 Uncharacterised protein [Legionella hackeliae]
MKKLAIVIGCFMPLLSFATTVDSDRNLDTFQELCAKEKDPLKRQNYCHILDQQSHSQATLADNSPETMVV